MPTKLIQSTRLQIALAVLAAYWVLALTIGRTFDWLIVTVCIVFVFLWVAGGVVYRYAGMTIQTLRSNDRGQTSQLFTGIFLAFSAAVELMLVTLLPGIIPYLTWLSDTRMHGFVFLQYTGAGYMHLTARRDAYGRIRKEDWVTVVVLTGAGLACVLLVIGGQLIGWLPSPE